MKDGRAWTAVWGSPRWMDSAWAHVLARWTPVLFFTSSTPSGSMPSEVTDHAVQEIRSARHLRHQQRYARPAGEQLSPTHSLAVDYFVYRAAKEIGALAAVLGGIDGFVFTAGIGENSAEIRQRICEASAWLGIETRRAGQPRREARRYPQAGSKVSAWVIPTNEELMIARHTGMLLGLAAAHA